MELIFETFKDHMTLLKIKILIYNTMTLYTLASISDLCYKLTILSINRYHSPLMVRLTVVMGGTRLPVDALPQM